MPSFPLPLRRVLTIVFVLAAGLASVDAVNAEVARIAKIPKIGCPSDGQQGPLPAPNSSWTKVHLNPVAAKALAYYFGPSGTAVLAPRGWPCLELEGSNGQMLFVTPSPIRAKQFFSPMWKGVTGFGVMEMYRYGGTSGRFAVAEVIARAFPDHLDFVKRVIAEKIAQASEFPLGPFPGDKMKRIGENVVEFETPPNTKGLGTETWLEPNTRPIQGVAVIVTPEEELDLLMATVRLPPNLSFLASEIVSEVRQRRSKDRKISGTNGDHDASRANSQGLGNPVLRAWLLGNRCHRTSDRLVLPQVRALRFPKEESKTLLVRSRNSWRRWSDRRNCGPDSHPFAQAPIA